MDLNSSVSSSPSIYNDKIDYNKNAVKNLESEKNKKKINWIMIIAVIIIIFIIVLVVIFLYYQYTSNNWLCNANNANSNNVSNPAPFMMYNPQSMIPVQSPYQYRQPTSAILLTKAPFNNNYMTPHSSENDKSNTLPNNLKVNLLYFYQNGCSACQNYNSVWGNIKSKISSEFPNIKLFEIDTDDSDSEEYINKFQVKSTPTLIICDPNGSWWDSSVGVKSFSDSYNFIVKNYNKLLNNMPRRRSVESYY